MTKRKTFSSNNTARILFIIPGFFLLFFLTGCGTRKEHHPGPAFYFWKTNFRLNSYEKKVLKETGTKTLYLRLFDIDWDAGRQKAVPVGILQSDKITDTTLSYIPVVYITQPCLIRLREKEIPELAAHMDTLITQLCNRYGILPEEIQIDCDWTRNSAGVYFSLLRQLKQKHFFTAKRLSCTIRLHQVKYTTGSGIPPVDKGMLMVYNMGNLTRYGGQNSILEPGEATRYLKNLGLYPLPLDVALPLYHWSVLFEQKRFKGILYNIAKEQFSPADLELREGHLYRIRKDRKVGGYLLKEGQEIRFEHPGTGDLQYIATYIGSRIKDSSFRLAFFHLDSMVLQQYPPAELKKILNTF